jgi:hypothetical protein
MGPVAWTTSPKDVVASRQLGTPVVWIGEVADFTYTERDDGLVLEWICNYLPFASPTAEAIRERPISVGYLTRDRFLANLVKVGMPVEEAQALKQHYLITPHYLLVAGTVDAITKRNGLDTVFLHANAFELSRTLVIAPPPPIGDAKMTSDGAIHVWLRAEPPGGGHADAFVDVKPGDKRYQAYLDHLGGLRPGEIKLVPPWPDRR